MARSFHCIVQLASRGPVGLFHCSFPPCEVWRHTRREYPFYIPGLKRASFHSSRPRQENRPNRFQPAPLEHSALSVSRVRNNRRRPKTTESIRARNPSTPLSHHPTVRWISFLGRETTEAACCWSERFPLSL